MLVVANYEIKSECSVVSDNLHLEIKHPRGDYRALIKNIPRPDYSLPFVLSLHLYFDAPDMETAKEIATERLADCLNMLAFTVGSAFSIYRLRQIVDCSSKREIRNIYFWSDEIENEDPQPFLDKHITKTIERLSEFHISPAMNRVMRWYRLGIDSRVPDDQFQCFWFALEILAETNKGTEKVPSNCPHCTSPLFCESCKTHPRHRRYQKQAIQALLHTVDKDFDDAKFKRLDKTRNGLMHGITLAEIENDLPEGEMHIVDTLGSLLRKALIFQFPREFFDGSISLGMPTTYIRQKIRGIADIQMNVPMDLNGNLDLSFNGTKVELVSDCPPQSALPSILVMTDHQYDRLIRLSHKLGEYQAICHRIARMVQAIGDVPT